MANIFSEVPDALSNTLLIAERCELDLGFKGYHLPDFPVPEGQTAETFLRELCEQGLLRRYGDRAGEAVYQERLDYELGIIHTMGFDAYFLIVWDLCQYAQKKDILYNARGSAAGSIVAYTLDITLVDPIQHGLIFERFLNPGRVSMPDIDLDFRDDRRAELMEYCARRYGSDKVAQIITFGTMKARAAIRDVGRVKAIPLSEVDRVAKLIPNIPGKPVSIEKALKDVPEFKEAYRSADYIRDLIDTAKGMEGVTRNAGTHAAGVVVTDKPIVEYLPLHRPTGNAQDSPIETVTQFAMSVIDEQGLLKVDFLGLSTLTVMAKACDFIRERYGLDFNLENIPLDDSETFELLGRGETAGVFQVEGAGMRRNLVEMKPQNLDHVIAMVALFRPGPMDFIPSYIKRMHGEEEIEYLHPMLEPILKETYGITVYQEQIMYSAMKLADYTASEADFLRKTVAKKKEKELLKQRDRFVSGAMKNGISKDVADQIFDNWEAFARYGFPKGHAADYGVISVQTAYLKAHYPVEYMTALLSVFHGDTDRVAVYAADCRRMGIEVLPPDVNSSMWDFSIEGKGETASIRFGLGAIKNVGQGPVEFLIDARQAGPFKDLNEFVRRADLRKVGKRALECLIKVGAMDMFSSRPTLLEAMDRIVSLSSSYFAAADTGQISMFGEQTGLVDRIELPQIPAEVGRREQLDWERELIGLYVSDHPLSPVMDAISQNVSHYSMELAEASDRQVVRVAGIISRIRPHTTKKGKPMGFVTIEDVQGNIDLVVFPRTWQKYQDVIDFDKIVLVDGTVDSQRGEPKILVDKISTELNHVTPLPQPQAAPANNAPWAVAPEEPFYEEMVQPIKPAIQPPPPSKPINAVAEKSSNYETDDNWDDDGLPPPPDAFPEGWDDVMGVDLEPAIAQDTKPSPQADEPPREPLEQKSLLEEAMSLAEEIHASPQLQNIEADVPVSDPADPLDTGPVVIDLPSPSAPSLPSLPTKESGDISMITVILRPTLGRVRDSLLLRRVFGCLISSPGQDRFAFHIFETGRGFLLDFPNYSTHLHPELVAELQNLVGQENVRIEPITFQ